MTWIGRAKATNRKKTVIRKWRRTNYREGVEAAANEANLWRLARWARKQARETIEAPQILNLYWQGEEPRTNEENAELLSKKFFYPELDPDLSDISNQRIPERVEISQLVSENDVIDAIQRTSPDKAPRPD